MRAYKVLSAVIVAALMIAVPILTAVDISDADVGEKSSSVYFKSKEGLSADDITKYINVGMSPSFIQTVLESAGDFNFGTNGFSITDLKTSNYHIETGKASYISSKGYQKDVFRIVELTIEVQLKANADGSSLFAGEFNGDTSYGFDKHVSVKQNEVMTLKGTLKTEYTTVTEKDSESKDSTYLVNETSVDYAERTEFDLDAVYKTSYGMEQSFRFTGSFEGYDSKKVKLDGDTYNIGALAIGDICDSDVSDNVSGKGRITMEYEGKKYSAESKADSFRTVYSGVYDTAKYSGRQTCSIDATMLMSEDEFKELYSEVKLKDVFDNFEGTNQELLSRIPSIGSVEENDFDKVDKKASEEVSSIKGEEQTDTSGQITIVVVCILAAVILVLVVAILMTHRRKNKWQ